VAVQAGRLVLEPGERGYRGFLPVTITYQGDVSTGANIGFLEPIAGAFVDVHPAEACVSGPSDDGRRDTSCFLADLQPGETRQVRLEFQVLTTPRAHAMRAADTALEVALHSDPAVRATAASRTLFRSTTGSLSQPQPYAQDTRSDLSVTAGDATLTEQPDGGFAGRVPVTVHWAGDAPHYDLDAQFALPAGFTWTGTDPSAPCSASCPLPGGLYMQGESRTFDLLVSAEAGTTPGATGTGSVTVSAQWFRSLEDVDPSDDTAEFTLTVG
jgi:hypothetical protein